MKSFQLSCHVLFQLLFQRSTGSKLYSTRETHDSITVLVVWLPDPWFGSFGNGSFESYL